MAIKIISLNTFGAPFLSRDINERFHLIAETLQKEEIDIICFQEVVLYRHLRLLKRLLRSYPYCSYKRFLLGPKGGLVIFSRLPIEKTTFINFSQRGSLRNKSAVGRIMRFGILCIRLKDIPLTVFTTHLIPNSDGDWRRGNRFTKYQEAQLLQLLKVVHEVKRERGEIILAGDFNIQPDSYLYKGFSDASTLHDAFAGNREVTRHEEPAEKLEAQTIDYIFTSSASPAKTSYVFQHPLKKNGRDFYITDHIGLFAEIRFKDEFKMRAEEVN